MGEAGAFGAATTAILNLIVTKPIAVFVWWLSQRANGMEFHERAELRRRVERAAREGRPVLFASNHLSMFDDPVLPMALYRTGARALAELLVLAALVVLCWSAPAAGPARGLLVVAALGWAVGCALFGARKTWWSLGDLVNFSGAAALRGKLEAGRERPLSRLQRGLLAVADRAIHHFMRSGAVRTVLVDRRAGEQPKRDRARALEAAVAVAARGEPIWIFFEGGRAALPGEIGPARRGIGEIFLALRARGIDPLVVAIRHRGLERVIPRGSRRWLERGHRIEVQWRECVVESGAADAQSLANAVRDRAAEIQLGKREPGAGATAGLDARRAPWARSFSAGRRLLATLLGWGAMVVSCLLSALVIPPTLLLARVWPGLGGRFNDWTRLLLRLYVRSLIFARFVVDGAEQRLEGARIVVANHQSWLDPIVLIALEPRLGGPVRRYLLRVPIFGAILRLAGFYESDVGELPSLERLRGSAEEARRRGGGLLFFPEGTRSRSGEVGPFYRGAFRAAVDNELPIQPVVIEGLDRVLPPGHWMAQTAERYPVRIRYLPPLRPPYGSGIRREVVRALSERVRSSLVEELARLRAERSEASWPVSTPGPPPAPTRPESGLSRGPRRPRPPGR